MKKHPVLIFWVSMLIIVIASRLEIFPPGPALADSKVLNSEEFSQMCLDPDSFLYSKVDFQAKTLNITKEVYSDYILAFAYPNTIQKEVIIAVNCQYPELKEGDSIHVKGYVKYALHTKNANDEICPTPLIVGTFIEKTQINDVPALIQNDLE